MKSRTTSASSKFILDEKKRTNEQRSNQETKPARTRKELLLRFFCSFVPSWLTMLSLSNITVSYDGSRILRGVNLTVPEHSLVCLMGRNGVGKTTTLKAIVGLVKTESGSVKLGTDDLTKLKPDERARLGIGY